MGRIRRPRVGLMGGSFNPIHNGHLFAAEEVLHRLTLDQVIFMPSPRPPLKDQAELADAEFRYMMTVLATASNRQFSVSRSEMEREGPSYTVDTIEELRRSYSARSQIYFIMGADSALSLSEWKDPERLLDMCMIVAVSRPGIKKGGMLKGMDARGKKLLRHPNFIYMETSGLNISSSEIRKRVREGRPYRYLVPEAVAAFIENRGLYR